MTPAHGSSDIRREGTSLQISKQMKALWLGLLAKLGKWRSEVVRPTDFWQINKKCALIFQVENGGDSQIPHDAPVSGYSIRLFYSLLHCKIRSTQYSDLMVRLLLFLGNYRFTSRLAIFFEYTFFCHMSSSTNLGTRNEISFFQWHSSFSLGLIWPTFEDCLI